MLGVLDAQLAHLRLGFGRCPTLIGATSMAAIRLRMSSALPAPRAARAKGDLDCISQRIDATEDPVTCAFAAKMLLGTHTGTPARI